MISSPYPLLLALTVLLGFVMSAPLEANKDLIHEYIPQKDGTVDHFAYHSSLISNSDVELDYTMMGIVNTALEKWDFPGK